MTTQPYKPQTTLPVINAGYGNYLTTVSGGIRLTATTTVNRASSSILTADQARRIAGRVLKKRGWAGYQRNAGSNEAEFLRRLSGPMFTYAMANNDKRERAGCEGRMANALKKIEDVVVDWAMWIHLKRDRQVWAELSDKDWVDDSLRPVGLSIGDKP